METADTKLSCALRGYPPPPPGCQPIQKLLQADECELAQIKCFFIGVDPVDDHGHVVPSDDPKYAKCIHDQPKKKIKRKPMETEAQNSDAGVPMVVDAGAAEPAMVADSGEVALTEAPGMPLNATEDILALMPKDGSGGSMITVILALVAVGGGGAAWKFYQTFAKQKHEQKMKELELQAEANSNKKDDDKHEKCAAERVALEAKLSALAGRLADAEKMAKDAADAAASKSEPLDVSFDADDMQERLAKLEKAMAAAKRAPGRPKKKKDD